MKILPRAVWWRVYRWRHKRRVARRAALAGSMIALGISLDRWARVAWCESNHNPAVTNSSSGALGLYQHLPRYWPDRLARSGWEGHGEWDDGRVNAFVSAFHAREVGSLQPWRPSDHCWTTTP